MRVLDAILAVEDGAYAIGVSGGADSVGLLHALRHHRPGVGLHVVHLDHQLRGEASAGDAEFVKDLAMDWGLKVTMARREELQGNWPANPSAKYRRMRQEVYRRVVEKEGLRGVILAHQADDQAETVFQRLLRRSSIGGLGGMSAVARVRGVWVYRPMLGVRREEIRAYLREVGQEWREDLSNESEVYGRNRVRRVLSAHERVTAAMIALGEEMRRLQGWVEGHAPVLGENFGVEELAGLPLLLGRESARRWLRGRGVGAEEITPGGVERLLGMALDAATAARQDFPGKLRVVRKKGRISAQAQKG